MAGTQSKDKGFYQDPSIAQSYAACRPDYPDELFTYLASLTPGHRLAWDCATGNGQAARNLARFYDQVVASDHSSEQLLHARSASNIHYARSEQARRLLPDGSVDLITAAQAVHWLDLDFFYPEVRRALCPTGVLAIWGYRKPNVSSRIDEIVTKLWRCLPWPDAVNLLEAGYKTLPFPFDEIEPPTFTIVAHWTGRQVVDYLTTWPWIAMALRSGPAPEIHKLLADLAREWGTGKREARWELYLRVGRVKQT